MPSLAFMLLLLAAASPDPAALPREQQVRQAVERSLPFLEKGGVAWMKDKGCVSCHRVAFMLWTHNEACRHGLAIDIKKIEGWTAWSLGKMLEKGKEGGGLDTMSQMLLARDQAYAEQPKAGDPFETLWGYVIERQNKDGSWPVEGQLKWPAEITTRWALLALATRDTSAAPAAKAREQALAWLKQAKPAPNTDALLLRLLTERRFGDPARAAELGKELLGRQRPDGGWSYRHDGKVSDAFATGQALYALRSDRVAGDDPAVRGAVSFLLRTQGKDGSWVVSTGSIHDPGKAPAARLKRTDEVHTYWGSAWATIGLLQTLPEQPRVARRHDGP